MDVICANQQLKNKIISNSGVKTQTCPPKTLYGKYFETFSHCYIG
jgi:hypothetical protein